MAGQPCHDPFPAPKDIKVSYQVLVQLLKHVGFLLDRAKNMRVAMLVLKRELVF